MQNSLHLVSESKKLAYNQHHQHENQQANDLQTLNRLLADRQKLNEQNLKIANLLIKHNCNINHRDYQTQETPIFKAIEANNYDLVKLFIREGVDLSMRNLFGNDVLSRSIQLGRFRIARFLIMVDTPIRLYSLFYNVPSSSVENGLHGNSFNLQTVYDDYDLVGGITSSARDNFLQHSLAKYEEFMSFLHKLTHNPRSLKDLARLETRNLIKRPISNHLNDLGPIPRNIIDLILFKDVKDQNW
jgi:ankyrin repeat protein